MQSYDTSLLRSYSAFSLVSTGMGGRLQSSIPPWYVIKPTRFSLHPYRSLNRIPALIIRVKAEALPLMVTSPRWVASVRR